MPWMSLSVSLLLFVSLFLLAFVRCFAVVIDVLSLMVCWNHVDGVAARWVSPCELLESCRHIALTPCRRCGEFVANVRALKAS